MLPAVALALPQLSVLNLTDCQVSTLTLTNCRTHGQKLPGNLISNLPLL